MGLPFIGAESMILLGFPESVLPARSALRKLGDVIRTLEEAMTWRRRRSPRTAARRREQTRARYPDETGFVERDGVRVFWERYGDGSPTILLMPTWSIVHSRHWKAADPVPRPPLPGRRRSTAAATAAPTGRPDPAAYADTEFVGRRHRRPRRDRHRSGGGRGPVDGRRASRCGSRSTHPERVLGLVLFGSTVPTLDDRRRTTPEDGRDRDFEEPQPDDDGWHKYNAHYWRRDWPGFAAWFAGEQIFSEPHSTKRSRTRSAGCSRPIPRR